jgi:hypothetical protein
MRDSFCSKADREGALLLQGNVWLLLARAFGPYLPAAAIRTAREEPSSTGLQRFSAQRAGFITLGKGRPVVVRNLRVFRAEEAVVDV